MPLNIPMPQFPGTGLAEHLLKGLDTGSALFSRYMQPIIQREQLAETGKYHQGTLAYQQKQLEQQALHQAQQMQMQKQQMAQAHAFDSLKKQMMQEQLKKLKNSNNPEYEFQQYQKMAQMFGGGQEGMPQNQGEAQPFGQGQGQGQELFNPESVPKQQPKAKGGINPEIFKQNPILRGFFKHKFGVDPLAQNPESPEEKRANDLQDKIQLENLMDEHKKALEIQKLDLKNSAVREKTIESARQDLPHLESTLSALKNMKKIAKNNPDLFGHNGIGGFGAEGSAERFSKTTNNPNAGAWQTLGIGPIVAAESKMSSKGNQLALKASIANKPNFSENQSVALSKINTNIKQIEQSIKEARKIAESKNSGTNKKIKVWDNQDKKWVEITQEEFDKDGGE